MSVIEIFDDTTLKRLDKTGNSLENLVGKAIPVAISDTRSFWGVYQGIKEDGLHHVAIPTNGSIVLYRIKQDGFRSQDGIMFLKHYNRENPPFFLEAFTQNQPQYAPLSKLLQKAGVIF